MRPKWSLLTRSKIEGWARSISRYVLPPLQEDIPPLPEAIAVFKRALAQCHEAEREIKQSMTEADWIK